MPPDNDRLVALERESALTRQSLTAIEEDVREIKAAMERIWHSLDGNGKPGLKTEVQTLSVRLRAIEARGRNFDRIVGGVIGSVIASAITGGLVAAYMTGVL